MKTEEKTAEEAATRAREIYPLANEDDYPENPNVNRLPRACQGAFVAGFGYAPQQTEALRKENARLTEVEDCNKRTILNQQSEIASLRQQLAEANGIIRSTYQIAARRGETTNWEAFTKQVKDILDKQHRVMYPTQYAESSPKQEIEPKPDEQV